MRPPRSTCFFRTLLTGAFLLCVCFWVSGCGQSAAPQNSGLTETGAYSLPWGLTLNKDASKLYVVNNLNFSVSVVRTDRMATIKTIPVACWPRYITFNRDYTRLYVTHDSLVSCSYPQTGYEKLNGTYVSVIDISEGKVVKEIAITSISGARSIASDENNDAIYVHSPTTRAIAVIDDSTMSLVDTDTLSDLASSVTMRYDSSNDRLYVVDDEDARIEMLDIEDPLTLKFDSPYYNAQENGYCLGTDMPNSCACSTDSDCASRDCDTSLALPQCVYSCNASSSKYPDGCICASDTDCIGGTCLTDSKVCATKTDIYLGTIRGYYDREKSITYSTTDAEEINGDLKYLSICKQPRDILPLPDQTAYVTCTSSNAEDESDPLLRIMWDDDGLANSGKIVSTLDSAEPCNKPTRMAADPTYTYAFVLCQGQGVMLVIDIASGKVLFSPEVPDFPIDIVVSSDYAYVSTSSANEIFRYSLTEFQGARITLK